MKDLLGSTGIGFFEDDSDTVIRGLSVTYEHGNGQGQYYSHEMGAGYGDGMGYGDGHGANANDEEYPFELIYY